MARSKGESLKITKEELEKLYFEENKSTVEIGVLYNCNRKNIDYYFKKFGIQKKSQSDALIAAHANRRGTEIDSGYVKSQVEAGRFIEDIAWELGVSRNTIYAHCSKEGLNFRNHSAQRQKQSERMQADNPVPKGEPRPVEVAEKRRDTMSQNVEYSDLFCTNSQLSFAVYAKKARHLAYMYYINNNIYEKDKVIDHIFSIKDGYACGVPIVLISHPTNLQLITPKENGEKGSASLISLYEFHCKIGIHRV